MISKIYNYINKFIKNNEKRDLYQVKIIVQSKKGVFYFMFNSQMDTKKGYFLRRREIAKAYGRHISRTIKEEPRFKGSIVVVDIICKIGTFKRKDFLRTSG